MAKVLRALDSNFDGRIDSGEIALFARMQNMDAAQATNEIASIDTNGDGVLDSTEIAKAFNEPSGRHEVAIDTEALPAKAGFDQASPSRVSMPSETTSTQGSTGQTLNENSHAPVIDAARKVAEELSLEEKEEQEARTLDLKTAEIRAQSATLVRQTVQDALNAGAEAAQEKSSEVLESFTKLEEEAQRAEVKAAALQAKSKMEAEEARDLMTIANQALPRPNA